MTTPTLTLEQFGALFPHSDRKAEILAALQTHALEYGVAPGARLAMFLAQFGHESGGFTRWVESFAYTPERLLLVFPRYFQTLADAQRCWARGHEAIAERVYGGRMGNRPDGSGDGWTFRGRGVPMLTGRNNYARMGRIVGVDLEARPERASEVALSVEIACAFFEASGCGRHADAGDVAAATRAINGGSIGLLDRTRRWEDAKRVLGVRA